MKSQYLDFVPNDGKDENYEPTDILVYTRKTKKRLFVGFIKIETAQSFFGECKFTPKDGIFFGKHCLLALSRYMSELDKRKERTE